MWPLLAGCAARSVPEVGTGCRGRDRVPWGGGVVVVVVEEEVDWWDIGGPGNCGGIHLSALHQVRDSDDPFHPFFGAVSSPWSQIGGGGEVSCACVIFVAAEGRACNDYLAHLTHMWMLCGIYV